MREAVRECRARIGGELRTVHRLQKKLVEGHRLELRRVKFRLRIHELQLVAATKHQFGPRLRTHANPIEARWRLPRSVRLDGDLEAERMQGIDNWGIELQQRLAARTHDETALA